MRDDMFVAPSGAKMERGGGGGVTCQLPSGASDFHGSTIVADIHAFVEWERALSHPRPAQLTKTQRKQLKKLKGSIWSPSNPVYEDFCPTDYYASMDTVKESFDKLINVLLGKEQ